MSHDITKFMDLIDETQNEKNIFTAKNKREDISEIVFTA